MSRFALCLLAVSCVLPASAVLAAPPAPVDLDNDGVYDVFVIDAEELDSVNLGRDVAVPNGSGTCAQVGCTLNVPEISNLFFDFVGDPNRAPNAQQLYRQQYDQLIILPTFNAGSSYPSYIPVSNGGVQNINLADVPSSQFTVYGGGSGIVVFNDIYNESTDASTLPTVPQLAQWSGHQWGPSVRMGNTSLASDWLYFSYQPTSSGAFNFWSPYLDTRAIYGGGNSYMGGATWTCNAGGTSCTSTYNPSGYSELDLYLMGLIAPSAMTSFNFHRIGTMPSRTSWTLGQAYSTAQATTRSTLSISNVIAGANGPSGETGLERSPNFATSRKDVRYAFVVVESALTPFQHNTVLQNVGSLASSWRSDFQVKTTGLGKALTHFQQQLDVLFLLDISGSFGDDMANFKANIRSLMDTLSQPPPLGKGYATRFALATFSDFPFPPYGYRDVRPGQDDFAYKVEVPFQYDGVTGLPFRPSASDDKNLDIQRVVRALGSDTCTDAGDGDNCIQVLSGGDWPQCQYEALWQAMQSADDEKAWFQARNGNPAAPFVNATGLDLNNDGDTTDSGEIPQTRLHADPDAPLLIYVFTDADFHDTGVDPDAADGYPLPVGATFQNGSTTVTVDAALSQAANARAHGQAAAMAKLQNTPFIMGMAAGYDADPAMFDELQQVVTASGGVMSPLPADSAGFDAAVVAGVIEPELNRDLAKSLPAKPTLRNDSTVVSWNLLGDSTVTVTGTFELPAGVKYWDLTPRTDITLLIDNRPVGTADIGLFALGPLWSGSKNGVKVNVTWLCENKATYSITGYFSPKAAGVSGKSQPNVLVQLGVGGDGSQYFDAALVTRKDFLWYTSLSWVAL